MTQASAPTIVERLRAHADEQIDDNLAYIRLADELMHEAADALEAASSPAPAGAVSWEDIQDWIDEWATTDLPSYAEETRGCVTSWSDRIAQAISARLAAPSSGQRVDAPLAATQGVTAPSVDALFANCDKWGAVEWFNRLAMAIRNRDKSVVEGNDLSFATYDNIAKSSAARLVHDFENEIRAALTAAIGAGGQGTTRPWQAAAKVDGVVHRFGCFDSKDAAALAHDIGVYALRRDLALLNFPHLFEPLEAPDA